MKSFLLVLIALATVARGFESSLEPSNIRPIIGIMSIDISHSWEDSFPNKTQSMAASYVKIAEAGGARVVPILCNESPEYYDKMFNSTNGLIIPGGGVSLDTSCYAQVGRTMIAKAMREGVYYPIWATCLGFELILHVLDEHRPNLVSCYAKNVSLPLKFNEELLNKSHIGRSMPSYIHDILSTQNVTSNFHKYCINMETFTAHGLDSFWLPLSTSFDENGLEFISLIEAKEYPFWGSQFHPEKTMFEWSPRVNNPDLHSPQSILASQFFANFFVEECRKSDHEFESREDEDAYVISNYMPVYTGSAELDLIFTETYLFD